MKVGIHKVYLIVLVIYSIDTAKKIIRFDNILMFF